jgi:hypothetical protein
MNPLDLIFKALMSSAGPGQNSGILDMSLGNVKKNLMKRPGQMEEQDLSSFVSRPKMSDIRGDFAGASSQYMPNRLYGGVYSALGGRRVRGGLLGE